MMADEVQIFSSKRDLTMNKYSVMLSKEENEMIFALIGEKCQVFLMELNFFSLR